MKSRQKLGQHFLRDPGVIGQIVGQALEQVHQYQAETLLEIGPGKGALTNPINEALSRDTPPNFKEFILLERDSHLFDLWQDFPLLKGDFLEMDTSDWLRPPMVVLSNLPYYAGTAILDRLSRHPGPIRAMTLMFQEEVAQRIIAPPHAKNRGSLSVWMQNLWDIESVCTVSPRAFRPPPKVDSRVLSFVPRERAQIHGSNHSPEKLERFQKLLKVCFTHRRKMLRSGLPKGYWQKVLVHSGIDPTLRAQALDWPLWQRLFDALASSDINEGPWSK